MENKMLSAIVLQTRILLLNLDETLAAVEETQLYDETISDWSLAEQLHHTLGSLDQWFINPVSYQEAQITLKKQYGKLTKADLVEYRDSIKIKIMTYLGSLTDGSLLENPRDCPFNRLTLILGQFRHLMYHIGLIHGCLRVHSKGNNPAYHGLDLRV